MPIIPALEQTAGGLPLVQSLVLIIIIETDLAIRGF